MVLDAHAVRQRCECLQTYVDADVVALVRQLCWLVLDRETCLPASRFTANRQGLDCARDVSVLFDFEVADFRELQLAVQCEPALWVGEAGLSRAAFETGKSSLLPALHTTEECFVGFVQTAQRILQHL